MKKYLYSPRFFLFFLTALACPPGSAMESDCKEGDYHHDKALTKALTDHKFYPEHFFVPQEGKIFDINADSQRRSDEIRKAALETTRGALAIDRQKEVQPLPSVSFPSFWASLTAYPEYILNSLPGWPSLHSYFSVAPSTPPLTDSFFMIAAEAQTDQESITPSASLLTDSFFMVSAPTTTEKETPEEDEQDLGSRSDQPKNPRRSLLSLDGGGMRGLMMLLWLEYLEEKTGKAIYKLFDSIIGTSIGSISALALTASVNGKTPMMRASDLVSLLLNQSNEIFPAHSKWNVPGQLWNSLTSVVYSQYDSKPLEELLQKTVGQSTLANSLTHVMVTAVNPDNNNPYIIDSCTHPLCETWIAGRATSAAPTFFRDIQLPGGPRLIDGGVWVNNPGLEGITGMKKFVQQTEQQPSFNLNQITLLSLGTGDMPVNSKLPYDAGVALAVGPIIEACMTTQVKGTEMALEELLEQKNYFRLNPALPTVIALDQLDKESLRQLSQAAGTQFEKLDNFISSKPIRKRLERTD